MKRNKIRLLFVLLVGFLFFQFLFSMKFSEPYPAIKFPGFGKVPQSSGKVKYTKYEVLAFSSEQNYDSVNTDVLFNNVPQIYVPGLLNNIIRKHNKKSSNSDQQDYNEFKAWISSRLHSIYKKDYYKVEIRKLEVATDTELNNTAPDEVSLKDKTSIVL